MKIGFTGTRKGMTQKQREVFSSIIAPAAEVESSMLSRHPDRVLRKMQEALDEIKAEAMSI